jgi:hypothetical protein
MSIKKCKECGKEISSTAKECPQCGKKQGAGCLTKLFVSLVTLFVIFFFVALIGRNAHQTSEPQGNSARPAIESPKTVVENIINKYVNGTYLVGKDIPSGLYRVILTDDITHMGYVERSKDLDMEINSIIANIVLTGNGYVEIKNTDKAVKLQGVELFPVDLKTLKPDIKREVLGGIYLVGYDVAPGTYKVEVTDSTTEMGYVERAKNVSMGMNDIIANEIVKGQGYVKIKKTDFAIKVQGARLIFQE